MYGNVRQVVATDKPEYGDDGKTYHHEFLPGCMAIALQPGSVRGLVLPHKAVLLVNRRSALTEDTDV